jgi:hypothetical protein
MLVWWINFLKSFWKDKFIPRLFFRKTETTKNHPHQNILVTRTEVKTLYKQKLPMYRTIFKLIWIFGIQLWGTASISYIEISECFQSKALRMTVDASFDPQTPTVKEEIRRYSSQYSSRLRAHPNDLIVNLIELPDNRRLRRHLPNDLPTRFLV